ncbi:YopX family protein [Lactococcus lactis]|uniref:YopX family protein n=1 Tax=Lactococcus lactis TaxID=1358 RepID=UPI001C1FC0A7|nr:YopX family protein [Lactococcus lactis]MBU7533436.1 hypothetical protein [Lactococcus lactis]
MIPKLRAWKKYDSPEMFKDIAFIDFNKKLLGVNYKVSKLTTRLDIETLDKFILMQSTGLKDKNGIEIYEGDVVKDNLSEKYIVKYNRGFCAYFIYSFDNQEEFMAIYPNIILEVIGNIYENPELLEDTKND